MGYTLSSDKYPWVSVTVGNPDYTNVYSTSCGELHIRSMDVPGMFSCKFDMDNIPSICIGEYNTITGEVSSDRFHYYISGDNLKEFKKDSRKVMKMVLAKASSIESFPRSYRPKYKSVVDPVETIGLENTPRWLPNHCAEFSLGGRTSPLVATAYFTESDTDMGGFRLTIGYDQMCCISKVSCIISPARSRSIKVRATKADIARWIKNP